MKRILPILILCATALPLHSQEAAQHNASAPRHFYRLTYVLKESDEGKPVNQRSFVMPASSGERYWSRVRAGSRFPVRNGDKTDYVDVGVNIDSHMEETPEGLAMEVAAEISSPATETGSGGAPFVRSLKTTTQLLAAPNKPATVFVIDDLTSHHRFEMDVTAVPEK